MPECMDVAWMHVCMNAHMVKGLGAQVGADMDAIMDAFMAVMWL